MPTGQAAIPCGICAWTGVAFALGLAGFLATVAFARFALAHRKQDDDPQLQIKKKHVDGAPELFGCGDYIGRLRLSLTKAAHGRIPFVGTFRAR